ncbi:MAG: DUF1223 domain-containing protein [Pseudomarimonas sp.]
MQNSPPLLAVLAMIISMSSVNAAPLPAAPKCEAHSGEQVMPLVELYTSEGCSSCPPADRWLSRVYAQLEANFLAFHVDYWDRLGWPDRFAQPAYSQRQRQRVNAAGERTVYTPQVMVGKQIQVDWRNDAGFERVLAGERRPASVRLSLAVDTTAAGAKVRVQALRLLPTDIEPIHVWLAQYSDAEVTHVKHGENGGVTLRHDRVVRQLWGPWRLGSEADGESPHVELQLALATGGLTAFAQDQHGQLLQSLSLAGTRCESPSE